MMEGQNQIQRIEDRVNQIDGTVRKLEGTVKMAMGIGYTVTFLLPLVLGLYITVLNDRTNTSILEKLEQEQILIRSLKRDNRYNNDARDD